MGASARRPNSFSESLIQQCVARVTIALVQKNQLLAHRSIDCYFETIEELAEESPLQMIGLTDDLCDTLCDEGVTSVEQLCNLTANELAKTPRVGKVKLLEIKRCLHAHGLKLKSMV